MLGLAVAHGIASGPDWVARWIAIAGVAIAVVDWLTGWRLWNREGAVLAFDVSVTPQGARSVLPGSRRRTLVATTSAPMGCKATTTGPSAATHSGTYVVGD
jgi:hypothetical protein